MVTPIKDAKQSDRDDGCGQERDGHGENSTKTSPVRLRWRSTFTVNQQESDDGARKNEVQVFRRVSNGKYEFYKRRYKQREAEDKKREVNRSTAKGSIVTSRE